VRIQNPESRIQNSEFRIQKCGAESWKDSFLPVVSCDRFFLSSFRTARSADPESTFQSFRTVRSTDPESRNEINRGGMEQRGFWIPARAPRQKPGRLAGMTEEKITRPE